MSIAAKANKVCKSIKKPMSIPSKTRKDQKAHEHSSNPCEKRLKPMKIATNGMTENRPPAKENSTGFIAECGLGLDCRTLGVSGYGVIGNYVKL